MRGSPRREQLTANARRSPSRSVPDRSRKMRTTSPLVSHSARLSVAGTPVPTYYDGFPKAPPTPPALSAVLKVGSRTRGARLSCAAGSGGGPPTFLRRAGLRSAVIVGSPRESFAARLRGPSAAWRAGETGGLSETRRSTSGQAYRLPTFRRTASRSDRVSEGPPVSPARRTGSQSSNWDTTAQFPRLTTVPYFDIFQNMKLTAVPLARLEANAAHAEAFKALAHPTRLQIFFFLVRA